MQVIAERLHAGREFLFVFVDEALRVALSVPAVIQVKIDVAGLDQAEFDHLVGRGLDQFFVDVGCEFVPGIPPHLRGEGEAFPFGKRHIRAALLRKKGADGHQAGEQGKENTFHIQGLLFVVFSNLQIIP